MNKFCTIALAATMSFSVQAQKKVVNAAENSFEKGELDKALENIQAALGNDETKDLSNTWFIKAEIFQAIGKSADAKYMSLSENPAIEAYDAYKKAIELDVKQKFGKKVEFQMLQLTGIAAQKGIDAFTAKNYEKAMINFELSVTIETAYPKMFKDVDTAMIYNTALAAANAKKFDKAIEYYTKAASYNYNGATTFSLMKAVYMEKGDTAGALMVLKKGIDKYSEDLGLIVDIINFYLITNQSQEALNYLAKAKEKEPGNATYLSAEGTLYEKINMPDKAVLSYKRALEIDSTNFDACFNLGVLLYNNGVLINNDASKENDNEKFNELIKKRNEAFGNSIPYFELAHRLRPKEEDVARDLRSAYTYLLMNDKLNALKAEMNW